MSSIKTPVITDEEIAALDPDAMSPQERVTFINDARIRSGQGEELTSDHLRFAVRCMRSERKASAQSAGAKKKPAVAAISLADF